VGENTYRYCPGNLFLALVAEVGELAEVYQWNSCQSDHVEMNERAVNEIADIAIYYGFQVLVVSMQQMQLLQVYHLLLRGRLNLVGT
jgi:uncharacterized membrane protein